MNQSDIVPPFVGALLLTIVVWIYMYARRIPFIVRLIVLRIAWHALG